MGMSIIEVAKKAGVSHGTVSNVINNRPNISRHLVAKVKAAIKELDYSPPSPDKRRGPKSAAKSYKLGFVRWQADSLDFSIEQGVERYCKASEINFAMLDAHRNHADYLDAIIHAEGIDGLIIIPFDSLDYRHALQEVIKAGISVVFVDRDLAGFNVSSVACDNFNGGYTISRHLLEQAKDSPVYYFGPVSEPSSCRQRYNGWRTIMTEFGYWDTSAYTYDIAKRDVELLTSADNAITETCELAEKLFNDHLGEKFGVFAANDYIARGIYIVAKKLGLQIGKDVLVGGFGDMPLCTRVPVALTSVSQNSDQVGYEAARILHKHLKGEISEPIHITVPIELKIRESSLGQA